MVVVVVALQRNTKGNDTIHGQQRPEINRKDKRRKQKEKKEKSKRNDTVFYHR